MACEAPLQMTDRVIGHYRVLEKIGSGAMGEVFRARDERLGRDVALKLIRPASSDNPDHLRRFELEARAAAALNHPNIVAIYDVGSDQGSPYIVCELLEGKTLRKRLAEGALPVRLAVDYALQVVQGLIAAHDRRITHRDLKPENLFVTTDGRVKILDFGVAKMQSSPEESGRSVEEMTTVTKSGTVVGTVAYMSPEQLRGKTVDHRSDLFSLGTILYEMLTGDRAFKGETEGMVAVAQENPPEIDLEKVGIPIPIQQIVGHCLEKDPENRFQSAHDLAFALDTLSKAPGGRAIRFGVARSRARGLPWAVAAVLLIATLLLAVNQWRSKPSPPSYRRLTFEEGTVYSARFAPDFRSIVYGAAWNGKPLQLFSTVGDSLLTQPLNVADANLLAVSRTGELAVALHGSHGAHLETKGGLLARTPLAGGSPREVLRDVSWADWDANGELAVVHQAQGGGDRIEYPIEHVRYESKGWISHLRVSPQGDKIAFMDHPALWDDRGSVCLIDLAGHVMVLTSEWESEDGLAWSPDGREIWFTAIEQGINRDLHAVNMSGRVRKILDLPEGMTLEDTAPDGRVLVTLDNERVAMATVARNGKAVDISWHDWDVAKDISPDGQWVLFEDSSETAGSHYSLAIRKIDGSLPVQLGEGSSGRLSPDGKWAISIFPGSPGQVKLVPIGPGQSRTIALPGLDVQNGPAHFLADGKRITLNASESGHGVRTYLVDLEGGKPIPITPEGIIGGLISPDGRYIFRANDAGVAVYSTAGGESHPIPDLEPSFTPVQWSEDNSSVYGYLPGEVPTRVYEVNLASGKKTLVQDLQPTASAGVVYIAPVVVTRDASRFAYSYYGVSSKLFIISGLR
jgi:eukaryotic-like serine/threonine-protein kinase